MAEATFVGASDLRRRLALVRRRRAMADDEAAPPTLRNSATQPERDPQPEHSTDAALGGAFNTSGRSNLPDEIRRAREAQQGPLGTRYSTDYSRFEGIGYSDEEDGDQQVRFVQGPLAGEDTYGLLSAIGNITIADDDDDFFPDDYRDEYDETVADRLREMGSRADVLKRIEQGTKDLPHFAGPILQWMAEYGDRNHELMQEIVGILHESSDYQVGQMELFLANPNRVSAVRRETIKAKVSRIRNIGQEIHNRGGFTAMQANFYTLANFIIDIHDPDRAKFTALRRLWRGVGDWL